MTNKKSKLLRDIVIAVAAVVIGTPLEIALMQPYSYYDTQKRLNRMERENPAVAQEVAETLASPNKSIISDLAGYGTQKAAREYLSR